MPRSPNAEPAAAELSEASIRALLRRQGGRWGEPLRVVRETSSTNDDARRAAQAGAPHGSTFVADSQRRGRGRGSHSWHSPAGSNIYLSLLLRPQQQLAQLAPLTLVVGVAVADVVDRCLGRAGAQLKWPNDVLVDKRKLAGILLESSVRARPGGYDVVLVVGVGLNVAVERFPPELSQRATSLRLAGAVELDRARIIALLVAAIERRGERFFRAGLGPQLGDFSARDVLRGERVEVSGTAGVAEGIDKQGRLLIRRDDGQREAVSSGQVSWRAARD